MAELARISVIIPFKNEQNRLPQTVETVLAYLSSVYSDFELILVDDGSTDSSIDALAPYISDCRVRLIQHKANLGKGAAVRTGVLESDGELVMFSEAINQGFDIAIGSRAIDKSCVLERQGIHRVIIGQLGNVMIKTILGLPFLDTQCGFKMYRRQVARELFSDLQSPRWSFDYEILSRAHRRGMKIVELPVMWRDKPGSKFHPLKDSIRCFIDLIRIKLYLRNEEK